MGLFDFFGRKREDEAKEAELRKEEAEKDSAAAQKEAHPGFRILWGGKHRPRKEGRALRTDLGVPPEI